MGARKRLEKPPLCPQELHDLMMWCWEQLYQFRPTFTEVKEELKAFQESQEQFQTNPNQDFSSQDNSKQNYTEQNHSNGGDSGFEHSGQNFTEKQYLQVIQQESLIISNQQDVTQEISDQNHSEEEDSDKNVPSHENSDHNETKVDRDCTTFKNNQNQFQIEPKQHHNTQKIIVQNHSELHNSSQSDSEHEHSDQNKTEEELTNFITNQYHPEIISSQKRTNNIISAQGLLKQENFDRSDSGFEGSDQNEKDFQYINAQTLVGGIENSNQISHLMMMTSNPIYNI